MMLAQAMSEQPLQCAEVWGLSNSSRQLTLPELVVHSALQVYMLLLPNEHTSQL